MRSSALILVLSHIFIITSGGASYVTRAADKPLSDMPAFTCELTLDNSPQFLEYSIPMQGKNGGPPEMVLRRVPLGKCADAANIVVTNRSGKLADIGTKWGPEARFSLDILGPNDKAATNYNLGYSGSLKLVGKPDPYPLKPDDTIRLAPFLLTRVPDERRIPGTYRVKAVFEYDGKKYESNTVEVKWPSNDKK